MRNPLSVVLLAVVINVPSLGFAQKSSNIPTLGADGRQASFLGPVAEFSETDMANVDLNCETCRPATVGWLSAEYLFWSAKGVDLAPLATTSPAGTAQNESGVLPLASTHFGGRRLHDDGRSGGRYSLGGWMDRAQTKSYELSYLELNDISESFAASAADFPILARPFVNTLAQSEDARLLNFPGLVSGNLNIRSSTEFQTYEFLFRKINSRTNGAKTSFLLGYRGGNLEDILRINETTTALSGVIVDTTFSLLDQFDTENEFHGATLGYQYVGPSIQNWTLEFLGKVALGVTSSRAVVNGRTTVVTSTGDTSISNAGLLVQGTNIGTFREHNFDTFSEFGTRMTYHMQSGLRFFFGYSFTYWGQVARAGSQVDRSINVSQVPPGTLLGDARPRSPVETEGFWAQGLNLGFSYDF